MCMAEAVINTLHIWLMSSSSHGPIPGFRKSQTCCCRASGDARPKDTPVPDPNGIITHTLVRPGTPRSSNSGDSLPPEDLILPVISAGVQCSSNFTKLY